MSCPNRSAGQNYNGHQNLSFNPNYESTPRNARSGLPNDYQTPIKPQRLFGSTQRSFSPSSPYTEYQSTYQTEEFEEIPDYYSAYNRTHTPRGSTPTSSYTPRSRSPSPASKTPLITRKLIYETTGPPDGTYLPFSPPPKTWDDDHFGLDQDGKQKRVQYLPEVAGGFDPNFTNYRMPIRPQSMPTNPYTNGYSQYPQQTRTMMGSPSSPYYTPPPSRYERGKQETRTMTNSPSHNRTRSSGNPGQGRSSLVDSSERSDLNKYTEPRRSSHDRSNPEPTRPIQSRSRSENTDRDTSNSEDKPCPSSCSAGKAKMEKLYNDFVNAMRTIIISSLIRRKRLRQVVEQSTKDQDDFDCRQKRAAEKASKQMENNFRTEITAIYNDLMSRRKQLHHDMSNAKNSRSSLILIKSQKQDSYSNPLHPTELKGDEQNVHDEFTKLIIEHINEYCAKDIELTDELSAFAETDCDSDTMSSYHQEYNKIMGEMENDFIHTWEGYETSQNSSTSDDDDEDDEDDILSTEMGKALQEILMKQYKMREDLEKKIVEECSECQTTTKNRAFPDSDRAELNNIHVDIMNDLWYAMDVAKQLMEERENRFHYSANENYGPIFRALLAIYRKCHTLVKHMADAHFDQRRVHQVENLSSIFVDEWTRLRKETNDELKDIIDSLSYTSGTHLNCQERKLKKMQEKEKADMLAEYRAHQEARPCRANEYEDDLQNGLAALETSHAEQWDMLMRNKLQREIDNMEKIYPKPSKEACVQTCSKHKKQDDGNEDQNHDDDEDSDDSKEDATCACTPLNSPGDSKDKLDSKKSKSQTNASKTQESKSKVLLPDLSELNEIEVKEMNELQKNLRQWQLARRSLLESINRGINK